MHTALGNRQSDPQYADPARSTQDCTVNRRCTQQASSSVTLFSSQPRLITSAASLRTPFVQLPCCAALFFSDALLTLRPHHSYGVNPSNDRDHSTLWHAPFASVTPISSMTKRTNIFALLSLLHNRKTSQSTPYTYLAASNFKSSFTSPHLLSFEPHTVIPLPTLRFIIYLRALPSTPYPS